MIWYLAHPLRPVVGETFKGNLLAARRIARYLWRRGVPVCAPWLWSATEKDDCNEKTRNAAMVNNLALLARCDAVVFCGPRMSGGMMVEAEQAAARRVLRLMALDLSPAGVLRSMRAASDEWRM